MNTAYRKPLPGTDARLLRRARRRRRDPRPAPTTRCPTPRACWPRTWCAAAIRRPLDRLADASSIERRRDLDFPWFPARVVCHDILGQTALVDLAGLRDAIAEQGGDPAKVNPGGAGAADRRPLAGGRVRRLRPGRVREEPRHRGSPQRGPLPLHRLDEARVRERGRDPAGQRHHAPDQPGADVAGDPRAGRRRLPGHAASAPTATRRTSMRWA